MHATQRLSAKYNGMMRDLERTGTALHQCLKRVLILNVDIPPYTSGTWPQKADNWDRNRTTGLLGTALSTWSAGARSPLPS